VAGAWRRYDLSRSGPLTPGPWRRTGRKTFDLNGDGLTFNGDFYRRVS